MAIDNITVLLTQEDTRTKLLKLVDEQHNLNLAAKVHKEEKEKIAIEFKSMGLKVTEFNKFVKYLKEDQGDLLNYERGLLESINELRNFLEK